jgi:hypothetical protein
MKQSKKRGKNSQDLQKTPTDKDQQTITPRWMAAE